MQKYKKKMKTTKLLKQINNRVNSGFMRVGLVSLLCFAKPCSKGQATCRNVIFWIAPNWLKILVT